MEQGYDCRILHRLRVLYYARTSTMFPHPPQPMNHFTKPHLPLISQRILFKKNRPPPTPTITQRLNLDQRIRRADRVRFSTSAPRHKSKEPGSASSRNPSRTSTPALVSDNLSDLSELSERSDDECSDSESTSGPNMIPKPPGAIGRKSGGYNLEDALGWEGSKYKKMIVSLWLAAVFAKAYLGCRSG